MSSRRYSPSLWMVLLLVAAILVPTTLAASRGDTNALPRGTPTTTAVPQARSTTYESPPPTRPA